MVKANETKEQRETRVLGSLCRVLSSAQSLNWTVDDYPDRKRTGASACDAILVRDGTRVAVEIEIVESYAAQKEDDARSHEVLFPAEVALRAAFPDLDITVMIPTKSVPTGIRWHKLRENLSRGLIAAISGRPDDFTDEVILDGVPFKVWIAKHKARGEPLCNIVRWAPKNDLCEIVKARLDHAATQLVQYKADGLETMVLLDSDDIALAYPFDFLACIAWVKHSPHVDAVYIVQSYYKPEKVYPARIGHRIFPEILPEFLHLMSMQSLQ